MRAAGRLRGDELEIGDAPFAAGDHVVIRRSDRRLGVVNGDRGTWSPSTRDDGTHHRRLRSGRDA